MRKNKTRIAFYILLALLVAMLFLLGKTSIKERKITAYKFDTLCEITAYSSSDKPLEKAVALLDDFDKKWSPDGEYSEISEYHEGKSVSEETREILEYANSFERDDLFNIYVNSLVKAWDIKNNTGTIPDVNDAMLDMKNKKGINLGGIAKGFAADKVAKSLMEDGIESALISLGGNVYALGRKPTGEEWRIGIADPKNPDSVIGSIRAENLSVVTSGNYQRFFEKDGVRYHHIFDPKTGYPADSGLLSCTVIGEDSALCDVLSTMIFVAGPEKGAEILAEYNVGGILITEDTVYFSKNLEYIFKQNSFDYKYEFIY